MLIDCTRLPRTDTMIDAAERTSVDYLKWNLVRALDSGEPHYIDEAAMFVMSLRQDA